MPTHQAHDQTSESHRHRASKRSFKERKPETYRQLDSMLQASENRERRRKRRLVLAVFLLIVAGALIAAERFGDGAVSQLARELLSAI